jgi:hypothetical protein
LVWLAAEFADSGEWAFDGSPSAAHWIADVGDIEVCTAREWIRIGRLLRQLPRTAAAFASGDLSYSKVRALTRVADSRNETELVDLAKRVPAGRLGQELAAWVGRNHDPGDLAAHQRHQRSITSRLEPDGMTVFTCRLPPLLAGRFTASLDSAIMRNRFATESGAHASAGGWPTLPQQRADALESLLTGDGTGTFETEIVIHVRGNGCAFDDGTPIPEPVVAAIAPHSFIRALIHDSAGNPIDASNRRRHPTARQKRLVRERDRVCVDCGTSQYLQYDHNPPFEQTGHTVTGELELRCSRCHRRRHQDEPEIPPSAGNQPGRPPAG